MATSSNWIPSREQDFAELCERWLAELLKTGNTEAFIWNAEEVTETADAVAAFLTARAAYAEVDSTKNRMAKDKAMAAAKTAMRDFANSSVRYNKKMRDEDKAVFGIRAPDRTPTPVTELRSFPEAEPDTSVIRQITLKFWDSATKKRGKRVYYCLRWETSTTVKGPYGEIGSAIVP